MRSSFTTKIFESVRTLRSEISTRDDNLVNIDYDLFLYESESCKFNHLLAIDPDIFTYDIDVQESYEEVVYMMTEQRGPWEINKMDKANMEQHLDLTPIRKPKVHWCKEISEEKKSRHEYWASRDPYSEVCDRGDSPDDKKKRYWKSTNDSERLDLTWEGLSLNDWMKLRRKIYKVKVLGIDKMPRTRDNFATLRARLMEEMKANGSSHSKEMEFDVTSVRVHVVKMLLFGRNSSSYAVTNVATAGNYTISSTYRKILNSTLYLLPINSNGNGFYRNNGNVGDETIYSVALCRGDVDHDLCGPCVNESISKLPQLCPNQKSAIVYYDYCMLKYSNSTDILRNNHANFIVYNFGSPKASDPVRFNSSLTTLINKLIGDASSGSDLRKFATGNITSPDVTTIFALVQCTPDLSKQQCGDCVNRAVRLYMHYRFGRVGGELYLPTCSLRYETYKFFNGSTLGIPTPPILQPSLPNPPPRGKKTIFCKKFHAIFSLG
uniref:Putative gnk2-like domain-containing protein n=1 Tax=Tanacetum cinerariifolium TaxID=118510 RepID=A0A6L2MD40_TANCI|nr:putative gnk2-like domain-containing protein [Tanacetum cinerariifolium]